MDKRNEEQETVTGFMFEVKPGESLADAMDMLRSLFEERTDGEDKANPDGRKASVRLVSMDDIPFEIPDEGQIEGTSCAPWTKGAPGPSGVPDSSDETPDVEDDIDEDDETELCEIAGDAYERSMRRQNARREAKKKEPEPPCKPGDKVTADYGRNTTETFIVEQIKWSEAMARWEMVSTDGLYYSIGPDSYRITAVVPLPLAEVQVSAE